MAGTENQEQLLFDNVIARALSVLEKVGLIIEATDEPEIIRQAIEIGRDASAIQDHIRFYRITRQRKRQRPTVEQPASEGKEDKQ